jgi:ArsR family transcriptional regulator
MDTTLTSHPSRSLQVHPSEVAEPCCNPPVLPNRDSTRTVALADRLKALADPTRLRILDLLVVQPDALCVCDITSQFDQHQPTISHHLRILRDAGLIRGEKRGVWSYYRATDEGKRVVSIVQAVL